MKWFDIALRAGVCLLVLAIIDAAVQVRFPAIAATTWRMPRAMPTSQIDVAAAALRDPRPARTVAFLGGSPAWGDAVEGASEAVPAQLESILREYSDEDIVGVVNMACNGQLVSDSYVLARYASEHGADLVVVQVTYHNFSPAGRDGSVARYPELAGMLGVKIGSDAAHTLGRDPTPPLDVTGSTERWLRGHWALYGDRERVASDLFGASPEQRLHSEWNEVVNGYSTLETIDEAHGTPFPELDPGTQSVMTDEWSIDADFEVSPSDSEIVMLQMLCRDVAKNGTPVLVYLSPVNIEALKEFGMFDESRFRANVSAIASAVERSGGSFVDLNAPRPLPMEAFADINHTTAAGCTLTAERLAGAPKFEEALGR